MVVVVVVVVVVVGEGDCHEDQEPNDAPYLIHSPLFQTTTVITAISIYA